jgi:hypothetical protein
MLKREILNLYKDILRSAIRFPSIKRNNIIKEIKLGFRENKHLILTSEIEVAINVAVKGLSQLDMYSTLNKISPAWVVNLDREPMPRKNN